MGVSWLGRGVWGHVLCLKLFILVYFGVPFSLLNIDFMYFS